MAEWQPNYWHWWVLGVLLLVVEMFIPGAFFLWMGISAGVVGLVVLLLPAIGLKTQIAAFAVLSIVTVLLARTYLRRNPLPTDLPQLNRRAAQYVGRALTLSEPIVNGFGTVRVDDSMWRIQGPDCPAGTIVEVVSTDGAMLNVRPRA
jgi:membrane protein implicated in regulation of membrane protease activity